MDKKFCKSDKVFVNLMQQVLNQSRFILVDAYDQHCTTPASIDTRLRALVQEQNMSQKKQSCKVTVVSTHCIKNKCPNAGEVQCKILDNLIRARDGVAISSKHSRDGAQADSADAHKMDVLCPGQWPGGSHALPFLAFPVCFIRLRASTITISATTTPRRSRESPPEIPP